MTASTPSLPSINEMKGLVMKSSRLAFNRCFAPPRADCKERTIRAHSMQNANVLGLLVENNHVYKMKYELDPETGPKAPLALEGRNEASTFAGLCGRHDTDLFRVIDTNPFDQNDPEHLFLVAYRTTLYGVHATHSTYNLLDGHFQEMKKRGVLDDARFAAINEPFTREVRDSQTVAEAGYNYKLQFDDVLSRRTFDDIKHDVFVLDVARPTLACSTLFHLAISEGPPMIVGVALSIFPVTATETIAILSYRKDDTPRARAVHSRVIESTGWFQKYELSRLVLNRCQNFVLAPSFVNGWRVERRRKVEDLFIRTSLEPDFTIEDQDFLLFA